MGPIRITEKVKELIIQILDPLKIVLDDHMKRRTIAVDRIIICLFGITFFSSCDQVAQIEEKARKINNYEQVAYSLSKENRELKLEISRLQDQIQVLKTEKSYLKIKLDEQVGEVSKVNETIASRGLASLPPINPVNDLVKFEVYKWTPSQVLAMAEQEFKKKNFEKSAQFFTTFSDQFPNHEKINDEFLFQAGVASFESKNHPEWTLAHLEKLVKTYPTSNYYRGAKLWMALTHLQLGNQEKFFETVEEFRKKYRNTDEWKILSPHYEKIIQKFKTN